MKQALKRVLQDAGEALLVGFAVGAPIGAAIGYLLSLVL